MFNVIWNEIELAIEHSYREYNKWYQRPNSVAMLHEIYYENDVPIEKIDGLKDKLIKITHNLFENITYTKMLQKEVNIQRDSEKYRFLNRNGIKVWLRMDLHYTDLMNSNRTVVDWKSGKTNKDDRYQLALYAHYVSKAYKMTNLNKIEIRNEYLLNNESKSYTLKQIDIDSMKDLIESSIGYMQSFLSEVDQNIPIEESMFEKTNNQSICSRCNFKEICNSK